MGLAVLTLNGGSSSWKIAAYDDLPVDAAPFTEPIAEVDLAWSSEDPLEARMTTTGRATAPAHRTLRVERGGAAVDAAATTLQDVGVPQSAVRAVGHRIVHGGALFSESVRVDRDVEAKLASLAPLAPSHNALELAGIAATRVRFPDAVQIAAFDTTFHRTLPPEAYVYPGPYDWLDRGIRRYGFHGLSVAYCVERVMQQVLPGRSGVQMLVAHLGGGASVTAIKDGASVATSMGFTPLDGTMMGKRSGAVDPGILTYLARARAADGASGDAVANELDDLLNHRSGLLGISGFSDDVRELEAATTAGNARAAFALDLFAHRAAATIAEIATSLDRIDALVFTGGIGEGSAAMRARICRRLHILGMTIDANANANLPDEGRIDAGGPAIIVIRTREDWYVARECARVLGP